MSDSAYFVAPRHGAGPGVLVLHSWWGLTPFYRRMADRLADLGHTALVPDLMAGATFTDAEEARRHLAALDANRLASLTLASAGLLREKSLDTPIAVVGFSMGASLALWASVRLPAEVDRVVAFYGAQSIDFAGARASYQLHLAEHDPLVSDDEAAFMRATMGMASLDVDVHEYSGTSSFFFEEDRSEFDGGAAAEAWERLIEFLDRGSGASTS